MSKKTESVLERLQPYGVKAGKVLEEDPVLVVIAVVLVATGLGFAMRWPGVAVVAGVAGFFYALAQVMPLIHRFVAAHERTAAAAERQAAAMEKMAAEGEADKLTVYDAAPPK